MLPSRLMQPSTSSPPIVIVTRSTRCVCRKSTAWASWLPSGYEHFPPSTIVRRRFTGARELLEPAATDGGVGRTRRRRRRSPGSSRPACRPAFGWSRCPANHRGRGSTEDPARRRRVRRPRSRAPSNDGDPAHRVPPAGSAESIHFGSHVLVASRHPLVTSDAHGRAGRRLPDACAASAASARSRRRSGPRFERAGRGRIVAGRRSSGRQTAPARTAAGGT